MGADRVLVDPEPTHELGVRLLRASLRLDDVLPELQTITDQLECSPAPTRLAQVSETVRGTGNDLVWLASEVARIDGGELTIPDGDLRAARLQDQEARACPDQPPAPGNPVVEFFGGAIDSIEQTAIQFNALTVELFWDPNQWASNWTEVSDHTWQAITNPGDLVYAVVDPDTFWDNPARWAGQLAPDAIAAVVGGASVANRTTRTMTAVDTPDVPTVAATGALGADPATTTRTAILIEGAGRSTRTIAVRPATDAKWGLTPAHVEKHLFGPGHAALRQIDPAGTSDVWLNYIQDLAGRPATTTRASGIHDVVGTFPKADGSGTFQFGIRIALRDDGAWDLVTLLTRQ